MTPLKSVRDRLSDLIVQLVDRLGLWPALVASALGSGLMAWSLIELARGL